MKKILQFFIALIIYSTHLAAGDWDILNQGIHGNINSIDFISETTGWAVGYNRTLIKTEDGGETWIDLSFEDNKQLQAVDFVNELIGWAYGWDSDLGKSIIIKTENGGQSWNVKYDTTDYSINTIYAVNEDILFAVGYHGLILKTSYVFEIWDNISPYGEYVNFRSMWFINDSTGVIIGTNHDGENYDAMILKTEDGGASWDEQLDSRFQDIYNLQFVNDSTGFFLGRDDTGEIMFCRTEDTLSTWSIQTKTTSQINLFYALSRDTIFSVMTDFLILSGVSNLKLSIDSGVNWMNVNPLGSWMINAMIFNSNLGFLSGIIGFGMIGEMGTGNLLLRSMDKGQNWDISILSYPFSEIHFLDKNKGFAAGGSSDFHSVSGEVYSTSDGGETWMMNFSPGSLVKTCQFLDDNIGYILCEGMWAGSYIYKTVNGGSDWDTVFTEKNFPGDNYFIGNDMIFLSENVGYVAGYHWDGSINNAAILATENGGDDWEIIWSYPSTDTNMFILNSIHFPDENHGYAVGANGIMVKFTSDSSWQMIRRQTELQLNRVFFTNELTGWISGGYFYGGTNELIFMTTKDGGKNWNIQTDLEYATEDIYFKDADKGWAVGMDTSYYGFIMATEDGGEHWDMVAENFPAPLRSIYFKDGFGWIAGDMGLILRTENGTTWIDNEGNNVSKMDFQLFQNYPNPFNPKTIISYTVGAHRDASLHIDLSIYNVLGQKVATLISEKQPAGNYNIEWDASNLASGIYLYRLQAGAYVETKKMIVMK